MDRVALYAIVHVAMSPVRGLVPNRLLANKRKQPAGRSLNNEEEQKGRSPRYNCMKEVGLSWILCATQLPIPTLETHDPPPTREMEICTARIQ